MTKRLLITMLAIVIPVGAARAEVIAILGDSIVNGDTIANKGADTIDANLRGNLAAGHQVERFGVGAATLRSQGAKPYILQPEFTAAKKAKPDVVVVILGTNDSTAAGWNQQSFQADYRKLVDDIRKWPSKPKVILCTPPRVEVGAWGIDPKTVENSVSAEVRKVAAAKKTLLVDLHAATKKRDGLTSDGVHPNAQGTKVIAEEIQKVIEAAR